MSFFAVDCYDHGSATIISVGYQPGRGTIITTVLGQAPRKNLKVIPEEHHGKGFASNAKKIFGFIANAAKRGAPIVKAVLPELGAYVSGERGDRIAEVANFIPGKADQEVAQAAKHLRAVANKYKKKKGKGAKLKAKATKKTTKRKASSSKTASTKAKKARTYCNFNKHL